MQRKRLITQPSDEFLISAVHCMKEKGARILLPFLDHPGTAVCICMDKIGNVLVVQQYRPVIDSMLIEFPGGVIKPGESSKNAARRETLEETGIRPLRLACIGTCLSSVGLTNERIHVFIARSFTGVIQAESGIHAFWIPLQELIEVILTQDAFDAKTAVSIWLLQRQSEKVSR